MANVKSKQGTKTNTFKNTKKKKQEEDRFGKKGKQLAKKANAEKTGESKLKKTGNSRADERREGAVRAQKNPVNVMRSGAQNYIIKDKAQGIATAPTKVVSGTLKNSQNTAGLGRGRRSGTVTNTTKRTETLTKDQLDARKKAEEDRKKKIADKKKANDKNGYSYGNGVIKTLDKYNKTVDKKFEESKKKDLNYGASVLSDKKVDIPFYTKYAQGKAEKAAKAELKKGGVTQAKGKDNVDKWIADTEKEWKSQGYDVKDDVVVTEDGKTWGQIKQEAYDQTAAQIRAERSKYIHQSADGAGKLSAQDIYKGVVPMASEFIDYGVPYMATAKGSIKVAEKLMAKAAKAGKAGKVGAKAVPKIEKEISKMVADGKLTPEAAAKFNKKIALKSGAKSFSKELVANALQDATIGTAIDLAKGIGEGLQGEELQKYMKDNAVANLALGIPMSGIAGRAGAKEAKTAMSMDYAKAINDAVNITKPEAIKLENLLKKQERGTISGAETETLKELQNKALGEGGAVVNSQGKLEINKTDFAVDDLTKSEATEYFKLKAQSERGSIDSRDIPRFNELRGKVESAYRQAEVDAQKTINVSGRKITSNMQENAEAAVRFYERTGDKAKLKQAQDVLEKAQKATVAKNEALATNLDKMNDITKGNYRWVDSVEMEKLAGDGKVGGYYDETTGEIIVNRDSPQAYQTIVGHETMHMLKAANREGYDKLANMLKDYVKELGDGQYDSLVAEVKRAYPELVAKGDTEGLDEELVSEMLGRYVFGEDDKFIRKLAGEEPSVLQKILEHIRRLFADNKNPELAEQFKKLEDAALEEIRKAHPEAKARGEVRKQYSRFGELDWSSPKKIDDIYMKAVESGDIDLASNIMRQNMAKKGWDVPVYHGTTTFGFTKIDLDEMDDSLSVFATDSVDVAGTYAEGGGVEEIGSKKQRPIEAALYDRNINPAKLQEVIDDYGLGVYLPDVFAKLDNERLVTDQPSDRLVDEFDSYEDRTSFDVVSDDTGEVYDFLEDISIAYKIREEIDLNYEVRGDVYADEPLEYVNVNNGKVLTEKEIDRIIVAAEDADKALIRELNERSMSTITHTKGIYQWYYRMENPLVVECHGNNWNRIKGEWYTQPEGVREQITKLEKFEQEYEAYKDDVFTKNVDEITDIELDNLLKSGKYDEYIDLKTDIIARLEDENQIIPEDEFIEMGGSKVFGRGDVEEYNDAYDTRMRVDRDKANYDYDVKDDEYYKTRHVTDWAFEHGYDSVRFKEVVDLMDWLPADKQTSDVYVVFSPEQVKSADVITYDDNGNIIPPSKRGDWYNEDMRYSRFGIKGATGEQKELGIKAEQMFKDGKTPEEIWNKTGVIVDSDGKAKWEFSDKDMKFKFKMKDLRGKDKLDGGRLEELLEHKELFDRYPQLKDVEVAFVPKSYIGGADGEYLNFGDLKYIRLANGQSKEDMLDSLIHEIQHAIQEEEGFAGGASPDYYDNVINNLEKSVQDFEAKYPDYSIEMSPDGTYNVYDQEDVIIDLDEFADESRLPNDKLGVRDAEPIFSYNPKTDEVTINNENAVRNMPDRSLVDGFKVYVEENEALKKVTKAYSNDIDVYGMRNTSPEYSAYRHTMGEWEAVETADRRDFTQEELDRTPRWKNEAEIKREDFDKYYGELGSKKMSKLSKARQEKVQSARDKTRATEKEISSVDKNLNGKITDARRKELEERRKTLEEQLEQERIELNKLNRPVYQERLERWEKELKSLESQKARARGNRLDEINRKIITAKSQITRNKNLIKNEPKKFVSDNPVNKLSDEDLTDEYRKLTDRIQKEKWEEIRERDAINSRIDALRAEAESRELDLRTNLERADDLVKDKGFGWQEAKKLANEIRDINKQIADIKNSGKLTMSKANKIRELRSEGDAKGIRLTQVLDNSKSVIPEGKNAIDAFDEIVGGNTLKEKGSYKKLNKMSAKRLVEENDGLWGAAKDVAQSVRRKTESSLIEYESAGKRLIKDGQKELGQALLDQANNVIVYKNKAAAAVETHRASADGTKTGDSLNDVFKVIDKNGKEIDLLLEANTKMRQDLSNYLFAKHSFAREEQGKKVFGMIDENGKPKWTNASTQEFMDAIVDKYGKKTVDSFERGIRDYIDYLNEYRLDTGLISKELLDKLNDIYPYYIPTNRSVVNKPPKEYELPKSTAEVENGIKRAVGGDAPLEDLYTQLVKMTMATIRSGEQNKLLSMYAKAHNIEATRLPKDATADDVLESSVEAFNSDHKGNWKIRFYDDGKAVTIPVNKHAAQGIREFNGQDYATLIEVSAKAGKLLHMREYKGLITDWNLVFGVRNGMRDAQQALVNSKDSRWFTRSVPRARAAVMNENNAFRILYDANGGRYSTLQQVNRLDEIGALNKNKSTVAKGLEKIEDFNGAIEMMPRMCEFIGTIQKEAQNVLGKDGVDKLMREIEAQAKIKPEAERTMWIESEYAQRIVDIIKKKKPDIIATAIRNSSDVTVNFSRHGVVTRAFNAGFVPYLNPSVQGLSKMARMFTESKAQGFGTLAAFGAKLVVLTIAPAIANEVFCKGNEAYQSLNSRDKDNNFFIPMSLFGGEKDKFIKIPKPRENAVLAEPFEYGYRYFMDNAQYGTKDEWVQMWKSAESNVGVVSVWEDNIVSPIINTALNKTWYGGDILSKQELKNVENEEAWKNFDETTSLFAKKMGKLTNKSPKKIDAIMDSYMGLIYDFGISQTSQKNINDVYSSPKNFLKNNAIVQQFTKDAVFSNKYATKFWDRVDELNKGHKGDKDTIEKREYMAKYGYDTFTYDTAISNIDNDKSIPKEEKVEMKRELRTYKNQLLKRALDGEDVKYDPMQRIINLYKRHGIKNATDVCLSQYAEGDHADAYKTLKRSKEYRDATPAEKRELQQKFLKTYKGIKRIARFTGDSDNFINYTTAEYVCVKNGYTGGLIANAYAGKSKKYAVEKGMENMKAYIDAGYTEKNFKITMRALNRGANDLNDDEKQYASQLDDYDKAMICAKNGYRDGAYLIAGAFIGKERMNAARCLTEGHSGEDFEWTDKRVNKFCKKYELYQDKKEYTWDLEQVADAVRKEYGDKTPEEQAAVYTVITGDTENNPFGEIGDYSHKNDSGLLEDKEKGGKGGRGRGGRGRRGGRGGGGSSKGTMPKTESGAIKAKVTDPFGGSNGTKSSNLNDAYRKRVRKLRETKKK